MRPKKPKTQMCRIRKEDLEVFKRRARKKGESLPDYLNRLRRMMQ